MRTDPGARADRDAGADDRVRADLDIRRELRVWHRSALWDEWPCSARDPAHLLVPGRDHHLGAGRFLRRPPRRRVENFQMPRIERSSVALRIN